MARDYYTISTKIQFAIEVEVDPMDLGEDDFDAIVEVGVEALTEACQSATATRTGLYARLGLFDGCFYPSLDEVIVRHWHAGTHPTYTETVLTGALSLATMNTSRTPAGKAQALNTKGKAMTNLITYTIRTNAGPVELIHVEVEVGELRHDGHYDIEVHATVNRQEDHFGINSPNVSITEALAAVQSVWPTDICIDVLRGRYDFLPPYDGDCAQAWEDACNGGMDTTDGYISGEAVGRLIVHSDVRIHDMHREW